MKQLSLMEAQRLNLSPFVDNGYWLGVKDGDPRAYALYMRHYSHRPRKNIGNYKIGGPGEKMILMTFNCDALFIWRKFRSMDGQPGISCAVFRNEGTVLSSTLICEAMKLAWQRWPGQRLFTYVNPHKVASRNPGYCFKMAGWRKCGMTAKRLLIFEAQPGMCSL